MVTLALDTYYLFLLEMTTFWPVANCFTDLLNIKKIVLEKTILILKLITTDRYIMVFYFGYRQNGIAEDLSLP